MYNNNFFKYKSNEKNTNNIALIIIISLCIFFSYVFELILIEKSYKVILFNENDIKIIFNLILSTMGIVSCLVSYNSNKKDEIFIMSLMYTMFGVDILNSKATGYLNDLSSEYYALLTSFIRVLIVYISVSKANRIKAIILKDKIKSLLVIVVISYICIKIEHTYIYPYNEGVSLLYKHYNLILMIMYIIIAFKYFKKSIIENDCIYGVIGSSALLFSIKSTYDYYYLINSNSKIYLSGYTAILLAFIVYIIGIFIELNKSTKINKELDEQRSLFIKIIDENVHRNVIICDENYYINYKNKKAKNSLEEVEPILNISCELGEKFELEKIFENLIDLKEIEKELVKNQNYRKEIYLEYNDSIIDLYIHLFEINNSKYKVINITDVSAKYKLEKTLIKFEAMEKEDTIKNEFFSNISHELKTPLNVIYSTNQLLDVSIQRDDFKEVYMKFSDCLRINCKRMLRLIDNIVDITKLDVGFKEPNFKNYNIVNIIEDMSLSVVNYAKTKEIDIIFDTDIEELYIKLDLDMLERIVLNLLSNAIKFSNKNSTVTVKIISDKEWVGIKVIDNGIGIDPEIQPIIFDRFVQGDKSIRRKKEGSGIGLSLVKSFVELMEGEIYLKSDGKSGSEFTVLLPNKILLDDDSVEYNSYNVDEERIKLEFSDIYELF
ncbi:MAG: sensor histidine kinase [Peptostreptococcaceae bacterium]